MTDHRESPTDPAPPMLEEEDSTNSPDTEPRTGRHHDIPGFVATDPPTQIPSADPVPSGALATVVRGIFREVLGPVETKIDDIKEIATTTATGVVDLNTKVAQLSSDREKDRRDIDRILARLNMPAAE